MDKIEKLSNKLYKYILKHGSKNIEKFLNKGADPELILDKWSYSNDKIDNDIVLDLFSKIGNIDQFSRYFERAMYLFIKEKSIEEIVEFAKKYENTLNVIMQDYKNSVVYDRDMNLVRKYSKAVTESVKNGVKVDMSCLAVLVSACSGIPFGDKNYIDRDELMENSYSLCKTLCDTDVKVATEQDSVGLLSYLNSPIVENDEVCIEYIFHICKLLIDKGADLHGDKDKNNSVLEDSICRKDFSNKLKEKLENYYSKNVEKVKIENKQLDKNLDTSTTKNEKDLELSI